MISSWELNLNKKPIVLGDKNMNLNSILSAINNNKNFFQLNPNFQTIRYIQKDEYIQDVYKYVEPTFNEVTKKITQNLYYFLHQEQLVNLH